MPCLQGQRVKAGHIRKGGAPQSRSAGSKRGRGVKAKQMKLLKHCSSARCKRHTRDVRIRNCIPSICYKHTGTYTWTGSTHFIPRSRPSGVRLLRPFELASLLRIFRSVCRPGNQLFSGCPQHKFRSAIVCVWCVARVLKSCKAHIVK